MSEKNGLLSAHRLDGRGGATPLGWDDLTGPAEITDLHWIRLKRTGARAQEWLSARVGLEPLICEALLEEETRPRCEPHGNGLFVILRGVNLNPGAEPEDMVSVRLWIEPHRVVTLNERRILAVEDIVAELEAGRGPRSAGDFLARLARRITGRVADTVEDLFDQLDTVEEQMLEAPSPQIRRALADLRRQAIVLRRHMAPQREVFNRLHTEPEDWIHPSDRLHLREVADEMTRLIEDLDSGRERAAITHEEIATLQAERMNRTMYTLTLMASVFLPLSFLASLFGINVGGIPWAQSPVGFASFCAVLAGVAGLEIWLFRRLRWF